MITVTILINGNPIYTRSAVNIGKETRTSKPNTYKLDTGKLITHIPDNSAVELAKKMLDTIVEVK